MTTTSPARRIAISETADPLDVLYERCLTLAHRVRSGQLSFIDAVDMAYSAAEWSGSVDRFGDDLIQLILADAFLGARP